MTAGVRSSAPRSGLARAFAVLLAAGLLVGLAASDISAAVTLVRFEASWQNDDSILICWETSSELDSVAFFLYRAEDIRGPWTDYIDFEPAAGNELISSRPWPKYIPLVLVTR